MQARAAQNLAYMNHMLIHFIKGMQLAIIPPLATLFSQNSIP